MLNGMRYSWGAKWGWMSLGSGQVQTDSVNGFVTVDNYYQLNNRKTHANLLILI